MRPLQGSPETKLQRLPVNEEDGIIGAQVCLSKVHALLTSRLFRQKVWPFQGNQGQLTYCQIHQWTPKTQVGCCDRRPYKLLRLLSDCDANNADTMGAPKQRMPIKKSPTLGRNGQILEPVLLLA